MTTISPTGFPEYPQIAYQNYKNLIAAFMKATVENKTIPCTKKGYKFAMKVNQCLSFPPPPLVFTFESKLSAAKNDALLALGCTTFLQGKEVYYQLRDYELGLVDTIVKHDPKPNFRTRVLMGSTNLAGIRSFFTCLRIVTAFLCTHSYPAFDGKVEGDIGGRYDSLAGFVSTKRKGTFEEREGKKTRVDPEVEDDEDTEMVDVDIDELGVEDFEFGTAGSAQDRVPKAKPTNPQVVNCGPVSTAPSLPGLLFPYFPGLLEDDRQFIPSVVRTYFLQSLGNDREEICSAFQDFKGGCGTWASSESGRILQHVFAGIQMALESQTRLYLLNDKKYNGFSMHGWYFHVSIYGRVYYPKEAEELTAEIRKSDEHANAILALMKLLKECKIDKDCPKEYKTLPRRLDDLRGARHLHELIAWRVKDDETIQAIDKLVAETSFPQKFRSFTVDNIIQALKWIVGDDTIPEGEPMYLGGGIARRIEKSLEAFSVFGELGPSFIVPGGKGVKIPSSVAADVQLESKGKNPPPLNVMVLSKKPLIQCMNDWETLCRTGVYLNRVERSTAFKSIRITDKEDIKQLWHFLIEEIGEKNVGADADTGATADRKVLGKRSEREDDDEFADFF